MGRKLHFFAPLRLCDEHSEHESNCVCTPPKVRYGERSAGPRWDEALLRQGYGGLAIALDKVRPMKQEHAAMERSSDAGTRPLELDGALIEA